MSKKKNITPKKTIVNKKAISDKYKKMRDQARSSNKESSFKPKNENHLVHDRDILDKLNINLAENVIKIEKLTQEVARLKSENAILKSSSGASSAIVSEADIIEWQNAILEATKSAELVEKNKTALAKTANWLSRAYVKTVLFCKKLLGK